MFSGHAPISHGKLLQYMKQLGYEINETGMCYGFAHMGMQAILADDLETYNRRLEVMEEIPPEKISSEIEKIRKKVQEKKPRAQEELNNFLTQKEQDILSIPAFFDGVVLYFKPRKYPFIFEEKERPQIQNAELTFSRALPKALTIDEKIEEKNGSKYTIEKSNVGKVESLSGIYNKSELEIYFNTLRETLAEQKYHQPISFVLLSKNHAVTVGYHPKKQTWQWIDSSAAQEIKDHEIANLVMSTFSKNNITAFAMTIYVKNSDSEQAKKYLNACKEKPAWIEICKITKEKAQREDFGGVSWLYITTQIGDTND